jgi:Putative prokaryotic signal transducing protein
MPPGDVVVLRKYSNEAEARLDASVLQANGIPAEVSADTAGGALPSIAVVFPVRLLVRADDAAIARELLDTAAEPPTDVGTLEE